MTDEKNIREAIHEAEADPVGHLRKDDTPSEPGKPEAVNLEREEPVTTAARRRAHDRDGFLKTDEDLYIP